MQPAARPRRRRAPGGPRGAIWIASALTAAALCAVPALARGARPLCRSAIFQCMGRDGVTHGKNLVVLLQEEKRSLRWVKRRCGAPLDASPYRCDWKRTVRTRTLGGQPRPAGPRTGAVPSTAAPARVQAAPPGAGTRTPTKTTRPAAPAVSARDKGPYAAEIRAAAARYRIPADLLRAVMKIESGFNPGAVSIKGAVGLMQLMPATAAAMGVTDPQDPAQNIMGGARFIRVLANRFKGDLVKVLSAYHAGSTRVKRRGGTPFASTDSYVRKVLGVYYALRDR